MSVSVGVVVGVGKCGGKNVSHKNKIHETNSAYILVVFPFPGAAKQKASPLY